jgi:hypothetical protein
MRVTPEGTTQSQLTVLLNVNTTSAPTDDSTGTQDAAVAGVLGKTDVIVVPKKSTAPTNLDIRRLFTVMRLAI